MVYLLSPSLCPLVCLHDLYYHRIDSIDYFPSLLAVKHFLSPLFVDGINSQRCAGVYMHQIHVLSPPSLNVLLYYFPPITAALMSCCFVFRLCHSHLSFHRAPEPSLPALLSLTCPSHSRLSLHHTHLYSCPTPSLPPTRFFFICTRVFLPSPSIPPAPVTLLPLTHPVTPSFRPPALAPAPAPPLRCLTDMTRQRGRRCGLSVSSVTDALGRVSAAWGEGRPCVNTETPPPLPIPHHHPSNPHHRAPFC